jgi:hypothetical protein
MAKETSVISPQTRDLVLVGLGAYLVAAITYAVGDIRRKCCRDRAQQRDAWQAEFEARLLSHDDEEDLWWASTRNEHRFDRYAVEQDPSRAISSPLMAAAEVVVMVRAHAKNTIHLPAHGGKIRYVRVGGDFRFVREEINHWCKDRMGRSPSAHRRSAQAQKFLRHIDTEIYRTPWASATERLSRWKCGAGLAFQQFDHLLSEFGFPMVCWIIEITLSQVSLLIISW